MAMLTLQNKAAVRAPGAHHKNGVYLADSFEAGQRLLLLAGFYPNRLVCDDFR